MKLHKIYNRKRQHVNTNTATGVHISRNQSVLYYKKTNRGNDLRVGSVLQVFSFTQDSQNHGAQENDPEKKWSSTNSADKNVQLLRDTNVTNQTLIISKITIHDKYNY